MKQSSLNQNIFRLIVGLVLLTAITILLNTWNATTNQAKRQISRDLKIAENVLSQVLSNREAQLINSAKILTADFGFKQAVASKDQATIDSVLLNHGSRINADLMALVSLEGKNITSTPNILASDTQFKYPSLIEQTVMDGGASSLLMLDGKLYQIIMLTVRAPTPIAIALVGFELNTDFIQQLKNVTQLDTSIRITQNAAEALFISTLKGHSKETIIDSINRKLTWQNVMFEKDLTISSRELVLGDAFDLRISILLSEDLNALFSEFSALQLNIAIIAGIAIVLSLLSAAMLSRKLVKPLTQLSELAQNISTGNYDVEVNTHSKLAEITHLSNAFYTMQTGIRQLEEEISFQAQHDILTGLYNRYHIGGLIDEKLATQQEFQVVGLNIIGFRGLNDVFGYQHGDLCLVELANRLQKLGGLSARLTGSELLWIPNININIDSLQAIQKQLQQPIDGEDVSIPIKLVLGLISCPEQASVSEELFRRLNIVLDESQASHRSILEYDEAFESQYLRRLAIITELKKAVKYNQDELAMFYQPKLNLTNNKIESGEALIRWNSPVLGFVPPDEFIGIAEQAGIIEKVTEWVIKQVISDISLFEQSNIHISVAVNLSARDIVNSNLLPLITSTLAEHNLDTSYLSLEMTESDLVKDPDKAVMYLNQYRQADFTIAIDDFGTGYSSLAYLKKFPVDTLKIDKSFVLNLDTQESDQHIVNTVIDLANSFDLKVVAEGVENQKSLAILKQKGCQWAQGYYICKPIPADMFIKWYGENKETQWLT